MTTGKGSGAGGGRPQLSVRTGKGYKLAEWLNDNWSRYVPYTNEEVAMKMGYKSPNIISMWRTGKTKVALERLPEIADLMKIDLARLMPLWLEQYLGEDPPKMRRIDALFKRFVSLHEMAVIQALRSTEASMPDPEFTPKQVEAMRLVAANPAIADLAIAEGTKQGIIREFEEDAA